MNVAAYERLLTRADRRCHEIAKEIVDEIRDSPNTPYDPEPDGMHLRTSYYVVDNPHGQGATVKTKAPYWHYVEFGTGHGRAQPHVRPAIEVIRAKHT